MIRALNDDEYKDDNEYRRFAKIWHFFEMGYTKRSQRADSGTKVELYSGRAKMAKKGKMILQNSNSSSILERSFSDSLRSVAGRRVTLSTEHIGDETFLRQSCKEKQSIISLMKATGHSSRELNYLLSCMAARYKVEKIYDPKEFDDDEVNNLFDPILSNLYKNTHYI